MQVEVCKQNYRKIVSIGKDASRSVTEKQIQDTLDIIKAAENETSPELVRKCFSEVRKRYETVARAFLRSNSQLQMLVLMLESKPERRVRKSDVYQLDLFSTDDAAAVTTGASDGGKAVAAITAGGHPAAPGEHKPRVHAGGGRKRLTGYGQVCDRVYTLSDEQIQEFVEGGFKVRPIGGDVCEYFQSINSVVCIKARRMVYGLVDKKTGVEKIVSAPVPPRFLPKTKVGDIFLADAVYGKYGKHLPWNRIANSMGLERLNVNRQDLDRYFMSTAGRLKNVNGIFTKELVSGDMIYADETPTKTQGSERQKDYFWVFNNSRVRLFTMPGGRAGDPPLNSFTGFKGDVMCDAYAAYLARLNLAIICICLAHVRRRFIDYRRIVGCEDVVKVPLDHIGMLFHIDKEERALLDSGQATEKEFIRKRAERSKEHLDGLKAWCEKKRDQGLLDDPALERAVSYTLAFWDRIENIYKTSIKIDNNSSERMCKVIKLGAKNWITNGSAAGAAASATMYSIIETAKLNGLAPRKYLAFLFMRCAKFDVDEIPVEDLEKLMPWNIKKEDLSIVDKECSEITKSLRPAVAKDFAS